MGGLEALRAAWPTTSDPVPSLRKASMKYKLLIISGTAASLLLGAAATAARSYNPMKWIKKPTASQQLESNSKAEKDLTMQLQALLPAHTTMKDACTAFKTLEDCVASLHASSTLQIKFNCVKWDVTAVRPSGDVKSCEAPPKALALSQAIRGLKPDVTAKAEAKNAEKSAREDIKNAGF